MIKFKQFFYVLVIGVVLYSCGDNGNNNVASFDHAAQAVIDNDSIVKFLKNNYYNETDGVVEPLEDGKTALYDDSRLNNKDVKENDIDYKLYYFVVREGQGTPNPTPSDPNRVKGHPTKMDSVLTKYSGRRILNNKSVSSIFDINTTWLTLTRVIVGWREGLIHFKGGEINIVPNEPIKYKNGGKGILFIPSGLAYRNIPQTGIPANSVLMFDVELWDHVEDTDEDNDLIPSIYEDVVNGDGDPRNDDSDGDGIPNYRDTDDDNDGKLTKDEDANKDGDPRNDFSDTSKPTVPDYLNRNIR
ncbi:FKBP-type peptidyl-prolyl cis-trans isomerase [Tenacibaculum sp. 190524A02b]|uniref:Peptidyl-prolyl cis-trans isomerase n=1 Tax=Tenacibaculum vairaonense TaxID=3137860 RepID=A0ABM9PIJ8_9FLAO